jgi:hypothetical protein
MPPAEIRETNNRDKKKIICSDGTEFSMDHFLSFKVDRHFQKDVTEINKKPCIIWCSVNKEGEMSDT